MSTIQKCKRCRGTGIVTKRLDDPRADDGELHTVYCWDCHAAGYVDETGRPAHINEVHLERD